MNEKRRNAAALLSSLLSVLSFVVESSFCEFVSFIETTTPEISYKSGTRFIRDLLCGADRVRINVYTNSICSTATISYKSGTRFIRDLRSGSFDETFEFTKT